MTDIGEEELLRRVRGRFLAHMFTVNERNGIPCFLWCLMPGKHLTKSDAWKYFLYTPNIKTENTISLVIPQRAELSPSQWGFHMWEVCPAVLVAARWKPHLSFSVPQMDQIYNSNEAHKIFGRREVTLYDAGVCSTRWKFSCFPTRWLFPNVHITAIGWKSLFQLFCRLHSVSSSSSRDLEYPPN